MACIVMAYIAMAYIVMAYIAMAYIVMACIVMAYIAMAYIVMAYIVVVCMGAGSGRFIDKHRQHFCLEATVECPFNMLSAKCAHT